MSNLIGRNTTYPIEMRKIYSTPYDNCTEFDIDIFEGEEKFTKDNNLLGKFTLGGIAPAAKGVVQINVTFVIDANGILNVFAVDNDNGNDKKITITKRKAHKECEIKEQNATALSLADKRRARKRVIDTVEKRATRSASRALDADVKEKEEQK